MGRIHAVGWISLGLLAALAGCAGPAGHVNPADPYEHFNRKMYQFNDTLDKHLLKPASDAYVKVTPQPVRDALGNAFDNLIYFNVILNEFLQGKTDRGSKDVVRWAINSTVGVAGLFDVATKLQLPKHDTDFGLTLGTWGAKQGNYLVLPLLGPTTQRDVWGVPVEVVTDPLTWVGDWWQTLPVDVVRVLQFRAAARTEINFVNQAALDPYVFIRQAYLQNRAFQLRTGTPPTTQPGMNGIEGSTVPPPALNYFEGEQEAPTTAPATQPSTRASSVPATRPASQPARR